MANPNLQPVIVSTVVPSYGRPSDIMRCIASITQASLVPSLLLEVIVVSNGYDEGTYASLTRLVEGAGIIFHLVRPSEILSTSESRNLGASAATGQYLLFVDDDNVVGSSVLTLLCNALDSWKDAYMVAPVMYYGEAPEQIWCAGAYRTKLLMRTKWRRQLPTPLPERLASDDFPNCFMVRTRDFRTIGGFDVVKFPQMFEEADLAKRLEAAIGGSAYCVPQSSVWHYIDRAPHRLYHMDSPEKAYQIARNRKVFIVNHGTPRQRAIAMFLGNWLFAIPYCFALRSAPKKERLVTMRAYLRGAFSMDHESLR